MERNDIEPSLQVDLSHLLEARGNKIPRYSFARNMLACSYVHTSNYFSFSAPEYKT